MGALDNIRLEAYSDSMITFGSTLLMFLAAFAFVYFIAGDVEIPTRKQVRDAFKIFYKYILVIFGVFFLIALLARPFTMNYHAYSKDGKISIELTKEEYEQLKREIESKEYKDTKSIEEKIDALFK